MVGTFKFIKNTQGSKFLTVWLTFINIQPHFIYIIIGRLIKSFAVKRLCRIKLPYISNFIVTIINGKGRVN